MAHVLLFHGMTGVPAEIEPLAEALRAEGHIVSVPLLPGHASSVSEYVRTPLQAYLQLAENSIISASAQERGPLVVGGLSFGALLALFVAQAFPALVSGGILLSCPLRLRSPRHELLLRVLSHLPEVILSRLPTVEKLPRAKDALALPRESYPVHAIGAAARLAALRSMVLRRVDLISLPLLMLQDPDDHLIASGAHEVLTRIKRDVEFYSVPGGAHELTLGHRRMEVFVRVLQFLDRL